MQTYLFYDIETTGLNHAFDQVLQFAAIRTDLQLNELERYELQVKLNADVVPAPGAIITHHIGIQESMQGIPEIEAMRKIHAWMNTPGTISLGYNTLGFDDEFLRFSFYRNLLTPYTHQYANDCGRMDIIPLAAIYYLFKNPVLIWPEKDGKISLKLELINQANKLVDGRSHHAMTDVEATLALAKRFYAEEETWNYMSGYFNKKIEAARLQSLDVGLMVAPKFGSQANYQWPVLSLGVHHLFKNQTVWLKLDADNFTQMTVDNFKEHLRFKLKKPGDVNIVLPFKDRFMRLTETRRAAAEANHLWLQTQPELFAAIKQYCVLFTYPVYPETDFNARLYLDAFWTPQDVLLCQRFHAAPASEKSAFLEKIQNKTLHQLALRLIGRYYPDQLSSKQKADYEAYVRRIHATNDAERLVDHKGQYKLTSHGAFLEIKRLQDEGTLSPLQLGLLTDLSHYLRNSIL